MRLWLAVLGRVNVPVADRIEVSTVRSHGSGNEKDVHRIREEDLPAWMYLHVVERVELPAVEVVEEDKGVVWRRGVSECKRRWAVSASGVDEE